MSALDIAFTGLFVFGAMCGFCMGYAANRDRWKTRATAAEAENAKLREALQEIAGRPGEGVEYIPDHGDETCSEARHMELIARAALETDNG